MTAKIVHIADLKNDNRLITPVDSLQDAIRAVEDKEVDPQKSIVLLLTTKDETGGDDAYELSYFMSGLKCSEAVSLLETAKVHFLKTLVGDD